MQQNTLNHYYTSDVPNQQPQYPNLQTNQNNNNINNNNSISTPIPTAPELPSNTDFSSSSKAPNQAPYNSSDHYPKSVGQEISSFANVLGAKIKEGWNSLMSDEQMPDRIPTRKKCFVFLLF